MLKLVCCCCKKTIGKKKCKQTGTSHGICDVCYFLLNKIMDINAELPTFITMERNHELLNSRACFETLFKAVRNGVKI